MCFQSKLRKEHLRAPREHKCPVDLTVLGHLRDLQGSDTEIFTFGYRCIEQKLFEFLPSYLVIDLA